jgi:hypothetical protein
MERFVADPSVTVGYLVENRLDISFVRNRRAEKARYPYLTYVDDDCNVEPD